MVEGGEWREYRREREEARERERELEHRRREEDEISEMLDEVERKIKEHQKINEMVDDIAREYRERGYMNPEKEHPSEERDDREHSEPEVRENKEDDVDDIEDLTGIDNLDDFEKALAEVFREYGHDPEKIKEMWEEKFKGEVQEQTEEGPENIEGEGGEREAQSSSEMEESVSYHVSPDGTVSVIKSAEEGVTETEESSEREVSDPEPTEKDEYSEQSIPHESTSEPTRTISEESSTESKAEREDTEGEMTQEPRRTKGMEAPELESEVSHSDIESVPEEQDEQKERVKEQHSDDLQEVTESETIEHQFPENKPIEADEAEDVEDISDTESDDGEDVESHRLWYAYYPEDAREPTSALPDDYSLSYFPEGDKVEEDVEDDELNEDQLQEFLENLPEEVLQHYREKVSEELESEEAYDKALEELLEMRKLSEEEIEEGRKYIRFREMVREGEENEEDLDFEKISKGLDEPLWKLKNWVKRQSRPRAIHRMTFLETERRLYSLTGPREIEEFDLNHEELSAFFEILRMFETGKIKSYWYHGEVLFRKNDLLQVSEIYKINLKKITTFLKHFHASLEDLQKSGFHLSKDSATTQDFVKPVLEVPATWTVFERLLSRYEDIRGWKSYGKFYSQAQKYYRIKAMLDSGNLGHLPARKKWIYLSKKFSTPVGTVKGWFTEPQLPRLVSEVMRRERKKQGITKKKKKSASSVPTPRTYQDFKRLLERHPYLRDRKGFKRMLQHVVEYYRLMELRVKYPNAANLKLAKMVDVATDTARRWLSGSTRPTLITQLIKNERIRIEHESTLSLDALERRVDPSVIYDILKPLSTTKEISLSQLTKALAELCYANRKHSFFFAELRPYNGNHGPRWQLRMSKVIAKNRERLQSMVNHELGLDENPNIGLRLGIVKDTLYFWLHETSKFDYLNIFSDEKFYFKPRDKQRLIAQAQEVLGIQGNYNLSYLIRQMTDYKEKDRVSYNRIISDFRPKFNHLRGCVLEFLLTAQNRSLKHIESTIESIRTEIVQDPKQEKRKKRPKQAKTDLKIRRVALEKRSRKTKVKEKPSKKIASTEIETISLSRKINHEHVLQHLKPLTQGDTIDIDSLSQALIKIYRHRNQSHNFAIAELRISKKKRKSDFEIKLLKTIETNRELIQKIINKNLRLDNNPQFELRIGLANQTLYFWKCDVSKFNYLSLLSRELFYFDFNIKKHLIEKTCELLGVKSSIDLSQLVGQMTNIGMYKKVTKKHGLSELVINNQHLSGDSLYFILSAQDLEMEQINQDIEHVGIGNQLQNPKIISKTELLVLLSRLFAIISSDGSIDYDFRVYYYEKNVARRNRVRNLISQLGNVPTYPIYNPNGTIGGFRLPNIIGRLLHKLGMPMGDKILQEMKLPDFIKYGSPKIQLAYLQELIPEDGWITIDAKGYARIGFARSMILYCSDKRHGMIRKLKKRHLSFIKSYGKRKKRRGSVGSHFLMSMGGLEKMSKHKDARISKLASEIDYIVRDSCSQHLNDERMLCEMNGIMTSEPCPSSLTYWIETERVTVKWQTKTQSQKDVALWGLLAPFNDNVKYSRLEQWMQQHPKLVANAESKIDAASRAIEKIMEAVQPNKEEKSGALTP